MGMTRLLSANRPRRRRLLAAVMVVSISFGSAAVADPTTTSSPKEQGATSPGPVSVFNPTVPRPATVLTDGTFDAAAPVFDGTGAAIGSPVVLTGPGLRITGEQFRSTAAGVLSGPTSGGGTLAAPTRSGRAVVETTGRATPIAELMDDAKRRVTDEHRALAATWDEMAVVWGQLQDIAGRRVRVALNLDSSRTTQALAVLDDLTTFTFAIDDDPQGMLRAHSDLEYLVGRQLATRTSLESTEHQLELRRSELIARTVTLTAEYQNARLWLARLAAFQGIVAGAPVPATTIRQLVHEIAAQHIAAPRTFEPAAWFRIQGDEQADKLTAAAMTAGYEVVTFDAAQMALGGTPVDLLTAADETTARRFATREGVVTAPVLWQAAGWIDGPVAVTASSTTSGPIRQSLVADGVVSTGNKPMTTRPSNTTSNTPSTRAESDATALASDHRGVLAAQPVIGRVGSSPVVRLTGGLPAGMGPDRAVTARASFDELVRLTGATTDRVLGLIERPHVESVADGMRLWRVRTVAASLGGVEQATGITPPWWAFHDPVTGSELVGKMRYLPTPTIGDPRRVDGERPEHIVTTTFPLLGDVSCSKYTASAVAGALATVAVTGLGSLIEPSDFGGCYAPRLIENSTVLSMHARGLAIDLNVAQNLPERPGAMDPRIVSVFKAFGMRWGGDWGYLDPMHFETAAVLDADVIDGPLHWVVPVPSRGSTTTA